MSLYGIEMALTTISDFWNAQTKISQHFWQSVLFFEKRKTCVSLFEHVLIKRLSATVVV